MKIPDVELNNGTKMPLLGLGTWQMPDGDIAYKAVRHALDIGYRLIDTAAIYGNEVSVGKAIRDSGIPREDIFLTTKLWMGHSMHPHEAFAESLLKLGLDYVDLYLIHWPLSPRIRTWKALEKIYEEGHARAVGVSNFTIRHLDPLLRKTSVVPAINQVEFHPYLFQEKLLVHCREYDIQLEAYSPLTRSHKLHDPVVLDIARRYDKTAAQVMLRWAIEHGTVVIPKAAQPKHQAENLAIFDFELSAEDMKALNNLSGKGRILPNPSLIP